MREWVRSLYEERFGEVLGEKAAPPPRVEPQSDEEAARRFEDEMFWEEYPERNAPVGGAKRGSGRGRS